MLIIDIRLSLLTTVFRSSMFTIKLTGLSGWTQRPSRGVGTWLGGAELASGRMEVSDADPARF